MVVVDKNNNNTNKKKNKHTHIELPGLAGQMRIGVGKIAGTSVEPKHRGSTVPQFHTKCRNQFHNVPQFHKTNPNGDHSSTVPQDLIQMGTTVPQFHKISSKWGPQFHSSTVPQILGYFDERRFA